MAEPIIKKRNISVIHDGIDESRIRDEFGKEQGIISVSVEREKGPDGFCIESVNSREKTRSELVLRL